MVIYMTRIMGYEPAFASVQLMLFEGTCYLTPILGAWLADSAWGRFKTILVFSIIYFLVSSHPSAVSIKVDDCTRPRVFIYHSSPKTKCKGLRVCYSWREQQKGPPS